MGAWRFDRDGRHRARLSGVWPRARQPDTRPLRVSIIPSEGRDVGAPAIPPMAGASPAARRLDGMPVLWVRDLASGEERALAGTDEPHALLVTGLARPGVRRRDSLKRVSADGGPVQVVTDRPAVRGGTWAARRHHRVQRSGRSPVPGERSPGGTATPVTKLQGDDWSHGWPSFLPDGRRFLFTAKLWTRAAEASEQGIYLGSLDSPEIRRLLPDPVERACMPHRAALVFVREGTLTAAPFDLATGRRLARRRRSAGRGGR